MPQIVSRSSKPAMPENNYAAVIRGVRPVTPPWGAPSHEFWFEVCETPYVGELVRGTVTSTLDERGKLSGWLRGLGIIIPPHDPNNPFTFDVETLVGKPCVVQVKHKTSKRGTVYPTVDQVYAITNYTPHGQVLAPTNRPLPDPTNQAQGFGQTSGTPAFPQPAAPRSFPPAQAVVPQGSPVAASPFPAFPSSTNLPAVPQGNPVAASPFPALPPAPPAAPAGFPPPPPPPAGSGPRPPFAGAVKFE